MCSHIPGVLLWGWKTLVDMLSFNVKMTVMSFGYRCNSNMIKLQFCSCTVSQFQHLWVFYMFDAGWLPVITSFDIKTSKKGKKKPTCVKITTTKQNVIKHCFSPIITTVITTSARRDAFPPPLSIHFDLLFICLIEASTSFQFSHQRWDASWFQVKKKVLQKWWITSFFKTLVDLFNWFCYFF